MPRIDPTRLLLCLRPLLNFQTGGIKSDKEVDKVFGLMSKFSKKLVSKCTYINILHATAPDILNLFMERGGWGMMYEWTVDAKQSKNNSLLNEILQLLLVTPATINRLKENSLPKEIKQISSRWECEESKAIAERIVAKWISIAKNETPSEHHQVQQAAVGSSTIATAATVGQEVQATSASQSSNTNNNMSNLTLGFERDVTQNMDIDGNYDIALSDAELNDLNLVDFNPEFFSTIDQHLSELNNSTDSDNSFLSTNANHTILIQNSSETEPVVQSTSQNVPSIVIKSSGGQHSVVKPVNSVKVIQQPHETAGGAQGQEKICLVTHNGQRVILRVQVPNNNDTGTSNSKASVVIPVSTTAQQDQQVTSTESAVDGGSSTTTTTAAAVETKRRRPRKDPTITNNAAAKKGVSDNKNDQMTNNHKQSPKTYSKKASKELETQPEGDGDKGKVKDKPKSKRSSNSNSKTSSSSSSSSSKRLSKSAAAAAAAAEAEKAEKLRQQSKEAKKKMKERMELEKKKLEQDKQKQKDSKTLKEIYGLGAPQTPVPKIPKKKPTFDEMIGVPGAKEAKKEKITREKQSESVDKSSKSKHKVPESLSNSEKETATLSNEKDANKASGENVDVGFGLHARPESVERGPVKERPRHQVKVYISSKSKNMDLLETMTKGSKSKSNVNNDANKSENTNKISGVSFEDALNSSSVGASVKPGKRPSLDSTGKGGDTKKPKLDDLSSKDKGSGENGKDSTKKGSKEEKKDRPDSKDGGSKSSSAAAAAAAKKLQGIQESSLFMDALTATRDTTSKSKRRRRISSSTDPKDIVSSAGTSNGSKDNIKSPKEDNQTQIAKPVFNFYRDTLNDDEDNESNLKTTAEGQQEDLITTDAVSAEVAASKTSDITATMPSDTTMQVDDFAPAEGEGKLKSCLCIHRPKGKPKKAVKWREEEELKEYHFFEMDETERVNVSRPNKNFSEMKILERNEEKKVVLQKRKMHNDSMEEQIQWRCPPRKLYIDPSTPSPKIESKEKIVQDERERSILQVFYFPGTQLPDHPSEVDVLAFEFDKSIQYRLIPGDDVPGQTKLYDLRKEPWPKPNGATGAHVPSIPNTSMPPMINPIAAQSFPNAFNTPQPTPSDAYDSFNPWSQSFAAATAAPVGNDPWKMPPEMPSGFSSFPPPAVNLLPPFAFPPAFSGPPPPVGSIQAPSFAVPPPFGAPPLGFDMAQNPNASREEGSNNSGRQPSRARDMDYRSDLDRMRRNDNRAERRQTDRSDRRDRDRGLDRRDRERSSFDSRGDRGGRDRGDRHFDKDRDYRHSDRGSFRRPPNGRRNTLCSYFAKGYCREGHKCGFFHPGVNGPSTSSSTESSSFRNNNKSSSPSSPPQATTKSAEDSCDNDSNRNKSPPRKNNPDPPSNHSSPTSTVTISSNSSAGSESSAEIPPIASPTEPESFDLPPSSPSDGLYPPGTEPKVIPYADEDWG